MPIKRRVIRRVVRPRRMQGSGIFSSIGNWFKGVGDKVYNKILKPAHTFVKDNKLISKGLSLLPSARAKMAGAVASKLGYGRNRKVGRPRKATARVYKRRHIGKGLFSNFVMPRRPIGAIAPIFDALGRGSDYISVMKRAGKWPPKF